jgi:hypothetical protein
MSDEKHMPESIAAKVIRALLKVPPKIAEKKKIQKIKTQAMKSHERRR